MIRKNELRNFLVALLGSVCALAASMAFAAEAQAPTQVATVFIVQGPAQTQESFIPYFDRITAIYKKHGVNVERELWTTNFAGPESFRWVIVVKYPSLQEFTNAGAALSSPEYQAANAELLQKGFTVLSSSLQFRAR
jgi:uncharacterized protein (DUF1330 family)